ncbi:NAD-glutamate dehydrogenase [Pseudonocardia sp. GCM10023141]|uniref:NAD-glutamate dehydrogenase n=1 Tax=Pseudonocardia sp. GCM10023141 TaxID=3252653 RepID=UPI003612DC44
MATSTFPDSGGFVASSGPLGCDSPEGALGIDAQHRELGAVRLPAEALVGVVPAGSPGRPRVLVVVDDMPFLIDAMLLELRRRNLGVHRVVHPRVWARRDAEGRLDELESITPVAESWIALHLDELPAGSAHDDLRAAMVGVISQVRSVVEGEPRIAQQALDLAVSIEGSPAGQEAARFLAWCAEGNLTFLHHGVEPISEPPEHSPGLLRFARGNSVTRVLCDAPPLRVTVVAPASGAAPTTPTAEPAVVHTFEALLSPAAARADVMSIPIVRERVAELLQRAGMHQNSWSGQRALEILQNYPRAELLRADTDSLLRVLTSVPEITDRKQVRLFLDADLGDATVSALVFLPRDHCTPDARTAIRRVLEGAFGGRSTEHAARMTESHVAIVHLTVEGTGALSEPDEHALEERLALVLDTWGEQLLAVAGATARGAVFPQSYRADVAPSAAALDLARLDALSPEDGVVAALERDLARRTGSARFRVLVTGTRVTLSSVLPVLQSLGLEVLEDRPYDVRRSDGRQCWIHDFAVRLPEVAGAAAADTELGLRLADAFHAAWTGRCDADGLNALVVTAGLTWQQVTVLRGLARYLQQLGGPHGHTYITDTVRAQPDIALLLVRLFEARFDPDRSEPDRAERVAVFDVEIATRIDAVANLDADRILRSVLSLVRAATRTNYFTTDGSGNPPEVLAFKFASDSIPDVPEPRPAVEAFVHAARLEGVHLRFERVARGGLRWSDRIADYRTEVLGLVRAQAVKNAVIVPGGAKGGFVVKRLPVPTGDDAADRAAQRAEVATCYRLFVGALLDLVDNRSGHGAGATVGSPPRVVRYDGDDSYLVVAADKGTATFSDLANTVAIERGFWLGDAFASGGSVGYDHKAMGITARGAWESVRRHFRELGLDPDVDEFTAVGIGDMSGDVFGNGMLLSPHVRLVAAFDHRHVFLDPDPDPAVSFAERGRLFALPRSSWADYDRTLISAGGGVWPRSAKSIPVSDQVRVALGLDRAVRRLDPAALIRAVLAAPVRLLWNGGIGTYVKASGETHTDAGDKTNDAVRIDATAVRANVIGEGGNLGLTQRGRIEYARTGGKINTDAVDNSAGVGCSDREVNLKILLDALIEDGSLTHHDRDALLVEMTDDVAGLVLADNIVQNDVLGVARSHADAMVGVHGRIIGELESQRGLHRGLEALPDAEELLTRDAAGAGLTSPELATLLAHVKLALADDIAASSLPADAALGGHLTSYFPAAVRDRFPAAVQTHPLRREIITTAVANHVVNSGGISYVSRLANEIGATSTDAARAHHIVTAVFGLDEITAGIGALAAVLPHDVTDRLTLVARRLLDRSSRWFLTRRPQPLDLCAEVERFGPTMATLAPNVARFVRGPEAGSLADRVRRYTEIGVPDQLARRCAGALYCFALLDIIDLADHPDLAAQPRPGAVDDLARLYFGIADRLDLHEQLTSIAALDRSSRSKVLARSFVREELYSALRAITLRVAAQTPADRSVDERIDAWERADATRLARMRGVLQELRTGEPADLAGVTAALHQVRGLAFT